MTETLQQLQHQIVEMQTYIQAMAFILIWLNWMDVQERFNKKVSKRFKYPVLWEPN